MDALHEGDELKGVVVAGGEEAWWSGGGFLNIISVSIPTYAGMKTGFPRPCWHKFFFFFRSETERDERACERARVRPCARASTFLFFLFQSESERERPRNYFLNPTKCYKRVDLLFVSNFVRLG